MSNNLNESALNYTLISLVSSKMRVLIVGGGKAGFIKAKGFIQSGCLVSVLSKEFCEDFNTFASLDNLQLIQAAYNIDFIIDKHIIIIATGHKETDITISADCEKYSKLYIFCMDHKLGNIVKPLQRETNTIIFGLHSKSGNPNASRFIANLIEKDISNQDDFIEYLNILRGKIKNQPYKDELMRFVTTEDFYFFYRNNTAQIVLQLFYSDAF